MAKATLEALARDDGAVYKGLDARGSDLRSGLQGVFDVAGVPAVVQGQSSMLQIYFTDLPKIHTYREAVHADESFFSGFAHAMIARGVFVHPDHFEHVFISAAHTEEEIARVLEAAQDSLRSMLAV